VDVKPGEVTTLSITPPPSAVSVTASEAADVWIDGVHLGKTPLNARPTDLGTHEVVVRRADGAERRFTVMVTVNPLKLHVDNW
jgi:hypothetical protein